MKCNDVRSRLVELFDLESDATLRGGLQEHLQDCTECAREWTGLQAVRAALEPASRPSASAQLKDNIMSRIPEILPIASRAPRKRMWKPLAAAAAALLVVTAASVAVWYVSGPGASGEAYAFLGQAAHAMAGLQSVHIQARMRTTGNENFDTLHLEHELMPVELWKEFVPTERWRVEKAGRVVVMDGQAATLWNEKGHTVSTGSRDAGFVEWLKPLMDADSLLDREIELAKYSNTRLSMIRETGPDGVEEIVLSVEATAQGDFSQSDHSLNSSIMESNNLRVYRFDPETHRLKGLQVYVHEPRGDLLAFEVADIRYDEPLDPGLFALSIPADAIRHVEPQQARVTGPAATTPDGMARAFLEACGAEDWDEALKYTGYTEAPAWMSDLMGSLQVQHIGKPYQSGIYPGWFVPYEVRLKSGGIKKGDLAVRNDNPARQFVFDGGW